MRKAKSLSEWWLFRVRRSGRRSSSFGKRVLSSGRRLVMRERRAFMRFSCSCSTAPTSTIPERSGQREEKSGLDSRMRQQQVHAPICEHICDVWFLPAETSTTAKKRAISSSSRNKDPSSSLNSNMASSKEPMPRALRDASEYVCPLRKVTVLSLGSNSEQNLTIRTCEQTEAHRVSIQKGIKRQKVKKKNLSDVNWTYLESAGFEQHDLVMLAESLEARDALCELHHFFNSGGEALGERFPHFLTGATGRSHGTWVERTCLKETDGERTLKKVQSTFYWHSVDRYSHHTLDRENKSLTSTLAPPFSFQGQGLWFWESLAE